MPISYRAAQTLIKRNDEPALRAALEGGLNPNLSNENGWTLLMLAAVEGSLPLGELLLHHGADASKSNNKEQTALSIATSRAHTSFVQLLTEQRTG